MTTSLIEDVRAIAELGVAVVIGTRNREGQPEISRAWGVRVLPARNAVELLIPTASNARALANLADNAQIAVTIVVPTTYRSMQIKGRVVATKPASARDLRRVQAHHEAFLREVEPLGLPGPLAARLLTAETDLSAAMTRIEMGIESIYDQTPGPAAGARL